jgi:DNA-binding response OmpR family regulator
MKIIQKVSHRLLLIDDDPNLLYLAKHYFEFNGFEVVTAANALEGITILEQAKPDLVICDVMMPGINGHAFVRQLKTNPVTEHIPVLFLSAKSKPSDRLEGLKAGADSYIVKPFDPEQLIAEVKDLLTQKTKPIQPDLGERQFRPSSQLT